MKTKVEVSYYKIIINAYRSMFKKCSIRKYQKVYLSSMMLFLCISMLSVNLHAAEFSIYRDGDGYALLNQMGKRVDRVTLIDINGQSVDVFAVKDEGKCPERKDGQGAGDYVGGKCLYPKPAEGCSSLGDDCNDVYGEEKCRCDSKTGIIGGGLFGPAVTLPAY